MASIERTAYPRFTPAPSSKDLLTLYTPTEDEVRFAQQATRSAPHQLTCLVLLKTFQRLGYFPRLSNVPGTIVLHLRSVLHCEEDVAVGFPEPRTLYRHHRVIREYLGVTAYGTAARHVAVRAVYDAAQTMDNPADLINVALETLIKERYELPGFTTLDRLARRIRALVNRRFFLTIFQRLSAANCTRLDELLVVDPRSHRSLYNRLKQLPKRPTLTHLQDWLTHREWLLTLGETHAPLAGLPPIKLKHFAAEAKALDVAEIRDFSPPKRYTLLLCLLHRMRTQTQDHLAEMFIKRMSALQTHAKEALEELRSQHQEQTVALVSLLADVVTICETPLPDADLGHTVRNLVNAHGSGRQLQETCEAVVAYNSDNYHPLLWRFYRSHRPTLFRFLQALTFVSTSQDQSLIAALRLLTTQHDRRSEWLNESVDLSFASERWQRTVSQLHNGKRLVNRRHFEVCVFVHLAAELKSGDIAIVGSEAYADYREQLLPWTECEPLVTDYCQQAGLPTTAQAFVTQLRSWLDTAAHQADINYPTNSQVSDRC